MTNSKNGAYATALRAQQNIREHQAALKKNWQSMTGETEVSLKVDLDDDLLALFNSLKIPVSRLGPEMVLLIQILRRLPKLDSIVAKPT